MLIDNDRKIIFVRHQKTASSTISNALNFRYHKHMWYRQVNESFADKNDPKIKKYIIEKTGFPYDKNHLPLYELKNILLNTHENKDKYFKFGFTRNPWDRLVSAREYLIKLGWLNQNTSFFNFLSFVNDNNVWNGIQMNTVDFCDGCDFIGRFENLQDDFNTICDKIGIPRQELPHKNKTNHKHYTKYYDDETRQIVAEKYAKDIEYFRYEFGE